jgi:glycosyltransferase involved in cell wall biosynthesis
VAALDALIVLSNVQRTDWAQFMPAEKIFLLRHGIDTVFFSPPGMHAKHSAGGARLRAVFSGQWLRDFETLETVVTRVEQLNLPWEFDLVVPHFARNQPACYRLAMSSRVRWHADLTDEELRDCYRRADLLVLPLLDSTANNGLLEATACGLPVIVTDVGGVRDYVTDSFAELVPPNCADAIVRHLGNYARNPELLADRGAAGRRHAVTSLAWPEIAESYVNLFTQLLGHPSPL